MTGPEARLNTEELALLYRVAETLLGEREYGELLASLLDAAIEGLAAGRGDRAGGLE